MTQKPLEGPSSGCCETIDRSSAADLEFALVRLANSGVTSN